MFPLRPVALALLLAAVTAAQAQVPTAGAARNADWIAAVVNQESVTAGEVERRMQRARAEAERAGQAVPTEAELRQASLDALIDERAMITQARDSGMRVDDAEIDRAVQNIALQNQLTLETLRQRLAADGVEFARFRANLRDQIMMERLREREVYQRIRITDGEIDRFLERQRAAAGVELNLAQILVSIPEGADEAAVAARRARAEALLARLRGGESFERVAREASEDGNRERGGEIGLRPAERLPDLFVQAVANLKAGEFTPQLLRSGAGFHILRVVERRDGAAPQFTQTLVRHILLRPSERVSAELASRRLAEYRRQIESGARTFEEVARQVSEDGSAAGGGDLGWMSPGQLVPEFEEAMNRLAPGALSAPVVSRFGVHLIQVVQRRQVDVDPRALREQARAALREQKFDEAYAEWARELRLRAYIEMREPPL
jgi:peptidyl-prolyl cis-trans isomerase SurA